MYTKMIYFLMLIACVPAAIATFVEVAGTVTSKDNFQRKHLKANLCFWADTGYHSYRVFDIDSPNGKRACSSDGQWCFKVVSFDERQGRIDYSIYFGNRESQVQSSVDTNSVCTEPKTNEFTCEWEIKNHRFEM
ncbi:5501_t:CDS:1 [Funneliformis mosseae]|uniref:5501_t:CDS:1 n=1 Tax=Funneliformis mosseae TaxID=27381 RepID=A0A9N9FZN1_FUNMO|nr:5501_t:CDS:1 [Funneliformis mosseae]